MNNSSHAQVRARCFVGELSSLYCQCSGAQKISISRTNNLVRTGFWVVVYAYPILNDPGVTDVSDVYTRNVNSCFYFCLERH